MVADVILSFLIATRIHASRKIQHIEIYCIWNKLHIQFSKHKGKGAYWHSARRLESVAPIRLSRLFPQTTVIAEPSLLGSGTPSHWWLCLTWHHLLKIHSFSSPLQRHLCHRENVHIRTGQLQTSLYSTDLFFCLCINLHCLNYCNFIISADIQ